MNERVLFCHGLESGPWGRKSVHLRKEGYDVIAPDGRDQDLEARVGLLLEALVTHRPPLVVGSSFGGIAGLLACLRSDLPPRGLLLCAPALAWPREGALAGPLSRPCPTTILHGIHDTVVSIDDSRTFAVEHGARLVEVDDDHRLAASLDRMVELLRTL